MTTGYVNGHREAIIPIDLFDSRGRLQRFRAIVDTGFDYYMALPFDLVQGLGLVWMGEVEMRVGTDEWEQFDCYAAPVFWLGNRMPIRVLQTPSEILLGTRLLRDSELTVQFWQGDSVSVRSRPD